MEGVLATDRETKVVKLSPRLWLETWSDGDALWGMNNELVHLRDEKRKRRKHAK